MVITNADGDTVTMTGQASGVLGDFGGDSGALQATLDCPIVTPTSRARRRPSYPSPSTARAWCPTQPEARAGTST